MGFAGPGVEAGRDERRGRPIGNDTGAGALKALRGKHREDKAADNKPEARGKSSPIGRCECRTDGNGKAQKTAEAERGQEEERRLDCDVGMIFIAH